MVKKKKNYNFVLTETGFERFKLDFLISHRRFCLLSPLNFPLFILPDIYKLIYLINLVIKHEHLNTKLSRVCWLCNWHSISDTETTHQVRHGTSLFWFPCLQTDCLLLYLMIWKLFITAINFSKMVYVMVRVRVHVWWMCVANVVKIMYL